MANAPYRSPYDTTPPAKGPAQYGYLPPPVAASSGQPSGYMPPANYGAPPAFDPRMMTQFSKPSASGVAPYNPNYPGGSPGAVTQGGTLKGFTSPGGDLNTTGPKMDSNVMRRVLASRYGITGPGATDIARYAHRAGATGGPAELGDFLQTGMSRQDAGQLAYLNAGREAQAARQSAMWDANLDIYKTGAKKAAELRAPWLVGGQDPTKGQGALNYADMMTKMAGARTATTGADIGEATMPAEIARQIALSRTATTGADKGYLEYQAALANFLAGKARMSELGYLPTGDQLHARDMVDYNYNTAPRGAGLSPTGQGQYNFDRMQDAKRKADADTKKTEADAKKAAEGSADLDLDAQGNPITRVSNGVVYESRGGRLFRVGSQPVSPFGDTPPATPATAAASAGGEPRQWKEGDRAKGPDGSVRRFVGGKWVAL